MRTRQTVPSPSPRLGLGSTALGLVAAATPAAAVVVEYNAGNISSPSALPAIVDMNGIFGPNGTFVGPLSGEVGGSPSGANIAVGFLGLGKPPVIFNNSGSYDDGGDPAANFYKFSFATDIPYNTETKPFIIKLGTSTLVDNSLNLGAWPTEGPPGTGLTSDWFNGGTTQGFVGFAYKDTFEAAPLYGYLEFAYDDPTQTLALLSFAYEDSGAAIMTPSSLTAYAAPIPEPATAALAAALLAGSAALYQRRRRAAAA